MGTRPKPTIDLVLEIFGRDERLLKKAYRGLNEVPLNRIYPHLNLDETIALAAISWGDRWYDINQYAVQIDQMDLYAIVNRAMGRGMTALNAAKNIPKERKELYASLNPFDGQLRERLERVLGQDEADLKELLKQPTRYYASEGQYLGGYAGREAEKQGKRLEIMAFLPVYLKKADPKTIRKGYATQIAGMVRAYPRTFELAEETAESVKVNKPTQLSLL